MISLRRVAMPPQPDTRPPSTTAAASPWARPGPRPTPHLSQDRGAQALELSLVLPVIMALLLLIAAMGQVVLDVLSIHQLASQAARTAAVAHDGQVHAALADAAMSAITITPPSGSRRPGQPVTVTLTRAIAVLGRVIDITASATFLTEDVP